ncbi:MAG TPA: DUF1844 domain-containing protein [Spirochaetes bacterium]|nr:DUF1844 domain-containing protein [Spirochaetota bacterium]
MAENDSSLSEVNFVSLVLTLSSSAWVGLGKIADPISGEIKQDLKGVKYTIDLLLMLREKTRGNLTDEEKKVLDGSISELQANFAETVFSSDNEKAPSSSGGEGPGPEDKDSSDSSDKAGPESDRKVDNENENSDKEGANTYDAN